MKLGLQLGYWGQGPNPWHVPMAQEAEQLGFDSVWVAESWGNDAFSFATWIAAHTSKVRICTGVVQMSGRTPTSCAMHAITVDHLSNGRFALGLGLSGPQVVEGWYGQPYGKPLARTREYVEVIRAVLRRDAPVAYDGEFVHLPYRGPHSWDMGKPLKVMVHPRRADLPIYLGAEGPKNVALAGEIADGWLPLYWSPTKQDVLASTLGTPKPGFEIAVNVMGVRITDSDAPDEIEAALVGTKAGLGFYIGGMGSRNRNFHKELMARMGYEREADIVQELFFEGRRDEAIAAVPTAFADEISLVGTKARVREKLEAWKESMVTTMLVSGDVDTLRTLADLVA